MSLTPSTPQFNLKSFWQRPEGKAGMAVVLVSGIAGLYGFSLILPWLILLAADTLLFGAELGVLALVLWVISNRTFRNNIKNIFQSVMRAMTSMLITIDPIGILENSVDDMEEQKGKLDTAIADVSGAKQKVRAQIDKNNGDVRHATSLKEQAEKSIAKASDALERQRYSLNMNLQLQEIGRKMHSNEKLQGVFNQTETLYNVLTRWQQLADFNIENTKGQVQNAKSERSTILASYKGMKFAQRIIKGDPEQLKLLNQDLEFLVEDNAQKLGEMEDFTRYSQKFLTDMDLEQGAAASDAEKMLAEYEQKLLSAGGQKATIPAQMSTSASSGKSYLD